MFLIFFLNLLLVIKKEYNLSESLISIDKLAFKINLSFSKNKSLFETSIKPISLLINTDLSKLILPFKTLNSSLASLKILSFFVDSIFTKVCTLIFSLNNKPDLINSLIIEFDVNKLEILYSYKLIFRFRSNGFIASCPL
jgi:hypothetical protein